MTPLQRLQLADIALRDQREQLLIDLVEQERLDFVAGGMSCRDITQWLAALDKGSANLLIYAAYCGYLRANATALEQIQATIVATE